MPSAQQSSYCVICRRAPECLPARPCLGAPVGSLPPRAKTALPCVGETRHRGRDTPPWERHATRSAKRTRRAITTREPMQRGLRQAGAAIVHQDGGAHAGSGGGAAAAAYPSHALQYHDQSAPSPGADSLDSLFQQHGDGGGGVPGDHRQQDVLAAAAAAGAGGDHPSVVGFLYCTFFDDENLWTAEYGGPRDCEVPIQGDVSEGGYLTGTGPHCEYHVDCRVVSGDPNAPGAGAKIVVDGLVRHSDGAPLGRCVFEKQRDAGRQGYKGLATWRLAACRQPTMPADPSSSSSSFEATGGGGGGGSGGAPAMATVRPRNRRFSPEYKVMTDTDWGDMDVWLALQCASPVFDRVGVDLRPLHFAALTTTDYLDKKQLIALTRGLCAFAGPATFTQSMLDAWGDLHANPVRSARPKYISRIHCRHWLEVFRKIMDFKIGLLLVNSGMLSRKDVSAARMANFGQMAYYNLDQATSVT